ncbi:MAG: serine hydrolase domain-containing protein [Sphingomonadaceae bacterium]|nr:serine hydrolase domain-containing protein [Sphingomonadaceae bacterium]
MIRPPAIALTLLAHSAAAQPLSLPAIVAGGPQTGPELSAAVIARAGPDGTGAAAAGLADIAARRPMLVETPVRVASISKFVTAIAVMRLVEAGRLDLDADVSRYLGWPLRNPAHPDVPVTLRLLMGHRSGLSDAGGYSFPLGTTLKDSIGPISWAEWAPGERFDYVNLNYGVVATVMEAATGERFDRLMQRLVLRPMRLRACYNWSGCPAGMSARAAVLYRKGRDETAWDPTGPWVPQIDLGGARPPLGCPVRRPSDDAPCDLATYRPGTNGTLFSPQGGLRISVTDLARIGRMIANGGVSGGRRLMKPATVALFLESRPTGSPAGETYGGLMREWGLAQCLPAGQAGTKRWCGHLGDAYGLYSGLWIEPRSRRVIAYAVTGSADDLEKAGKGPSGMFRVEEALWRAAEALPVRSERRR